MFEENEVRAAGRRERQPKHSRSSDDYHDWQMLQLELTAEHRLHEASLIAVRGEIAARKEVQRCTIVLDHIRRLRTMQYESVSPRLQPSGQPAKVSVKGCARNESDRPQIPRPATLREDVGLTCCHSS